MTRKKRKLIEDMIGLCEYQQNQIALLENENRRLRKLLNGYKSDCLIIKTHVMDVMRETGARSK